MGGLWFPQNGQLPASPDGLPSRQGGGRRRQGSEPRVFERLWGDAMAKQRAQSRQQREGSVGPWGARLSSLGTALWVSGLRRSEVSSWQQSPVERTHHDFRQGLGGAAFRECKVKVRGACSDAAWWEVCC